MKVNLKARHEMCSGTDAPAPAPTCQLRHRDYNVIPRLWPGEMHIFLYVKEGVGVGVQLCVCVCVCVCVCPETPELHIPAIVTSRTRVASVIPT